MKKHFFTLLLCLGMSGLAIAQDYTYLGVSYSVWNDNMVLQPALEGAPGYYGNGMQRIDMIYKMDLATRYDVQLGMQYSYHKIRVEPNVPPGTPALAYQTDLHLITLPVLVGVKFWKVFYLHGGPLLSAEVAGNSAADNQTGLGMQAGLGLRVGISKSIRLFTQADFRYHSIISLGVEKSNDHLLDNGISAGVLFMLP